MKAVAGMFPGNTTWNKNENFPPTAAQIEELWANIWLYFKLLSFGVIFYLQKITSRLLKIANKGLVVSNVVAENHILFYFHDALFFNSSCKWQNLILEDPAWLLGNWSPSANEWELGRRFPWSHLTQSMEDWDALDLWESSLTVHVSSTFLLAACLEFRCHEWIKQSSRTMNQFFFFWMEIVN